MSRSYRKTALFCDNVSNTRFSKRNCARRVRHAIKRTIKTKNVITDSVVFPTILEIRDNWYDCRKWAFDPQEFPHMMRK